MRLKWDEMGTNVPLLTSQRQLMVADQLGYLMQLINPLQAADIEAEYRELLTYATSRGVAIADALLNDGAIFSNVPIGRSPSLPRKATPGYNDMGMILHLRQVLQLARG